MTTTPHSDSNVGDGSAGDSFIGNRSVEESSSSPWAHPSSQEWFDALFERSRFHTVIEEFLDGSLAGVTLTRCRAILFFLVLLGRQGIWPKRHLHILERATDKFSELISNPERFVSKTMSMEEHRQFNLMLKEARNEVEILRRRFGKSRLRSKLGKPKSWGRFWD
jgi:hypothetical protein